MGLLRIGLTPISSVKYGIPQGLVLGPHDTLIHINDLNKALRLCIIYHFADTNLLHFNKSVNRLNK